MDVLVGNRHVEVQVLGHHSALDSHGRLDQTSNSGSTLEVANVRLQGSDENRLTRSTLAAKCLRHGEGLFGVTGRSAGSMALNISRLVECQASLLIERTDVVQLRLSTGHGDTRCATVLVHARATDDGSNRIVVAQRIVESLQDDNTNALAAAIALCLVREGEALSLLAQEI